MSWESPVQSTVWRLTIASVYFLVGVLFFYSGKQKLFDGDAKPPAEIARQFEGTFVATFPGVDALCFGATAIVILLVLMLPPNRPRAWLSGLGR